MQSHYDGGLLRTLGGRATTLLGRIGGTICLSRPYTFSVAAAQPPSTLPTPAMPLFSTHTDTPNHVNQFSRPSIIRARSPLRHHGAPAPAGAIPVTPFRNALLTNMLLRASPAAVSSARLAANQPFSPLAPTTSASRCFPLCSTVPNSACSPPAPQASTKASAAAERAPSCAEGGGRGIKEQPCIARAMASSRARPPCCSRYSATTRCSARLPIACRVVGETMPLAFGSASASAHRHRCE
ncbi:hypothetical protein T492DRAFT_1021468 [Pavlovales sp. CCMP2436]|nr:hypothetical protein T492DRAFT_1021468 [Pavlovales sp. CCMP2436]